MHRLLATIATALAIFGIVMTAPADDTGALGLGRERLHQLLLGPIALVALAELWVTFVAKKCS